MVFPGFLLAALAACGGGGGYGGGGGGSAMQSSPQAQNLEAAPAPKEPFNIPSTTLTATSAGRLRRDLSQTPNDGTTMFDGQAAYASAVSLTLAETALPSAPRSAPATTSKAVLSHSACSGAVERHCVYVP